jgi:hypothetical protein
MSNFSIVNSESFIIVIIYTLEKVFQKPIFPKID